MRVPLQKGLNNCLEVAARTEVYLLRRSWPVFRVLGCVGVLASVCLSMTLITNLGLSRWVMAGLTLSAMTTFCALAMTTKIIVGEESLIYYHQEIAVMVVAAAVLRLLRQPVLPYLDVMILGVGAFLACGRVGCLLVGCCHGRPHVWGVRYREEHAAAGFPPYLLGVRLFPVQLVEALCVTGIVVVGVALALGGRAPGAALGWYAVGYGVMRFCLEFARGDSERRYLLGFSEAQWTSLLLMCAVVWAELSGAVGFRAWHIVATVSLAAAMIVVALRRRFDKTGKHQLLHPRHVKEVAEAFETLAALSQVSESGDDVRAPSVYLALTSRGIRISASVVPDSDGRIHLYALSRRGEVLEEETARTLAALILKLRHPFASCELVRGGGGVFHALMRPPFEGRAESRVSQSLLAQEGRHAF
jgi:hypothetical protein